MQSRSAHKVNALIFLLLIFISALIIAFRIDNVRFEADILSCLPKETKSGIDESIIDEYTKRIDSQIVFLVKDTKDKIRAYNAVKELYNELKNDDMTADILGYSDSDSQKQFNEYIYKNSHAIISNKLRKSLEKDSYDKKVLSSLFSGFAGVSSNEIASDPLLLTRNVVKELSKGNNIRIKDGFLYIKYKDDGYYFLNVTTKSSAFNLKSTKLLSTKLTDLVLRLENNYSVTILKRGTLFYSQNASQKSENDISLIGSLSLIGVFSLIFFVFRSVRTVVLALLSVFTGVLSGFAAVLLFFDSVNIILLAMALSIIGIVCDYTIYYMTLRLRSQSNQSAFDTIRILKKPLSLAVATDAVAYLIILLSPIEPLKQLSVFCMVTITVSCLFVLTIEPYLCQRVKRREFKNTAIIEKYLSFVSKKKNCLTVLLLIILICALCVPFTSFNNDPKSFQSMDEKLKSDDLQISLILKQTENTAYFAVQAKSVDELLYQNEVARKYFDSLIKESTISSYKAIPLNSQKTQIEDIKRIENRLDSVKNALLKNSIFVSENNKELLPVQLDDFIKSKVGQSYAPLLCADKDKKVFATLIIVQSNIDRKELAKTVSEKLSNTKLIDRHDDFVKIFEQFSIHIIYVLVSFIFSIFVISTIRVGLKKALYTTFFSILCVLCATGALPVFNYSINLFNELALILVLGIGVNYTIFFTSYKGDKRTSISAIITSLLTTVISVGLLCLSSVNVIASFAITLNVGIIVSFILATLLPGLCADE